MLNDAEQKPVETRYARNRDLDPQLVWRGKDEQDWSDLVVQAPPFCIQEKVHAQALVDDLWRETHEPARRTSGPWYCLPHPHPFRNSALPWRLAFAAHRVGPADLAMVDAALQRSEMERRQ